MIDTGAVFDVTTYLISWLLDDFIILLSLPIDIELRILDQSKLGIDTGRMG